MKKLLRIGVLQLGLGIGLAASAGAVPVLQVGVPDGSGGYVAYTPSSTDPTETDTAITNGNSIVVGGVYKDETNKDVLNLGGQYGTGLGWSALGVAAFEGHGAVVVVSVPDGSLASTTVLSDLKLDSISAFGGDAVNSYFPNNHDPVQVGVADFLFFDIGNFTDTGLVPNFADSTETKEAGEIKAFTFSGMGSLSWIHFDVMAIETTQTKARLVTTVENNPGSHDVTWKDDGGGGGGGGTPVPEPATMLLFGSGLMGVAFGIRRKK